MKVIEKIKQAKDQTLFSIEILPPQKGKNINDLFRVLDPLMEFKPAFVDVTYHPEEMVYKRRADGLIEEAPLRKRPGTVGICAAISYKYNVETVPHLVCVGFTKEETEDALFSLYYQGIENLLLLKGDDHNNLNLLICDFGSAKALVKGEPNVAYICSRYYRAPELIFGSTEPFGSDRLNSPPPATSIILFHRSFFWQNTRKILL